MVVVQIESETFPGEFCYLMQIGPNIWTRHLDIATSFPNRAKAIMAIEVTRSSIMKESNASSRSRSFAERLKFANIVSVEDLDNNVRVRENEEEKMRDPRLDDPDDLSLGVDVYQEVVDHLQALNDIIESEAGNRIIRIHSDEVKQIKDLLPWAQDLLEYWREE